MQRGIKLALMERLRLQPCYSEKRQRIYWVTTLEGVGKLMHQLPFDTTVVEFYEHGDAVKLQCDSWDAVGEGEPNPHYLIDAGCHNLVYDNLGTVIGVRDAQGKEFTLSTYYGKLETAQSTLDSCETGRLEAIPMAEIKQMPKFIMSEDSNLAIAVDKIQHLQICAEVDDKTSIYATWTMGSGTRLATFDTKEQAKACLKLYVENGETFPGAVRIAKDFNHVKDMSYKGGSIQAPVGSSPREVKPQQEFPEVKASEEYIDLPACCFTKQQFELQDRLGGDWLRKTVDWVLNNRPELARKYSGQINSKQRFSVAYLTHLKSLENGDNEPKKQWGLEGAWGNSTAGKEGVEIPNTWRDWEIQPVTEEMEASYKVFCEQINKPIVESLDAASHLINPEQIQNALSEKIESVVIQQVLTSENAPTEQLAKQIEQPKKSAWSKYAQDWAWEGKKE